MEQKKKSSFSHLPVVCWLTEKMSRKMVLTLLLFTVLGWVLSFSYLIHSIQDHTGQIYDQAMEEAHALTLQVASFLEGSQGDYSGLTAFLDDLQVGCSLQDSEGNVIYQHTPASVSARLTASGRATVLIPGNEPLDVHVWASTLNRTDLVHSVGQRTLISLTVFNLAIFLVALLLLYVLLVAPIMALRSTMQAYSEEGALPARSTRRDEVGKLQNTFADLIGLLRAKEQSEHRLIASISHDIKTPLTSVLGYSERLLSASLTPEKKHQYIQGIHDKGLAIKTIVDEFDEYLDAGIREDAPMEPVKVKTLCETLDRDYRGELADAGVTLNITCKCPEVEFLCNLPHMVRYFGNLIGNSIHHAKSEQLELNILCTAAEGYLSLEFTDNGVGVPPALLQQIFEPLYTTDRGRKVSGLGLSICRSIIQSHGGSVTAANRIEGGLSVRALVPISRSRK